MPERSSISTGSSPRLRGTGTEVISITPLWRFIPAPAGNGCGAEGADTGYAVHPRACGERTPMTLMRDRNSRFIPAPAGNGRLPGQARSSVAVHPRACGERGGLQRGDGLLAGSSPRLRGTA